MNSNAILDKLKMAIERAGVLDDIRRTGTVYAR